MSEVRAPKKQKVTRSELPKLSSFPLDLTSVNPSVAALLRTAARKVTRSTADAARESTFPYLQSEDANEVALYTSVYVAAQLYFAEACILESTPATAAEHAKESLRAVDLALLRGGLDVWGALGRSLIARAEALKPATEQNFPPTQRKKNTTIPPQYLNNCADIPRVDALSLSVQQFHDMHLNSSTPVILTNAIDSWPAMQKWSTAYLKSKAADRLVPVETYAHEDATQTYLSDSWEQRVMSLSEYIDNYIDKAGEHSGYLAQYQLFDQIPSLRDDIITPEYCNALTGEDRSAPPYIEVRREALVSSWFGPAGTVSPLHNDPYHNLLAQVVGSKYIRLYDISQTAYVYPREGPLCNNSLVDLDNIDNAAYPLINEAVCSQCVLQAGELLYIPRHCWHYVRSLETSFSVSFWFGARMALEHVEDGTFRSMY